MNISERVHGFIQPVKTSFGTAVTKTSETVKKASKIASKILEVLFTPVTYLLDCAKSFYNKRRNQPASPEVQPSIQPEVQPEVQPSIHSSIQQTNIDLIDSDDDEPKDSSYSPLEQQVYENLRAQILGTKDNSLMSNLARRAHFEARHEAITNVLNHKAKAKAEARPAAAAFLTNITQQAVTQYANRTQVSHRTPTSLTKATSIKTAHGISKLANHISVPVVQGGSAADFPPLNGQRQNKAARRRGQQ